MSAKLQHTLLNLESAPPPGAWQAIAARLEEEYDANETPVADKLYNWEAAPPANAFENILQGLQQEEQPVALPVQKEKAILLPFRKVAIAAAITGLLVLAGWIFFTGDSAATNNIVQNDNTPPPVEETRPVTESADNEKIQPTYPLPVKLSRPRPARVNRQIAAYYTSASMPVNTAFASDYNASYLPVSQPEDGVVKVANASAAPNVAAPLIRDEQGKIILDEELIKTSDNNYIIVTAPNGERTRISSRFLQMLSSMNSEIQPSDYFEYFIMGENSSGWKIRFNEWRNKLLQQVSFVPAATNFLDILELKDMMEEK